ncbi:uncharacterized protein LOC125280655 isoform X2 [Megalobrama amblycephala]|uniref:uncharacterized protein LOC125280655 isoform X2 n=1 Tax=Megalobrama amblycephala TaxID=75352 RepID=UPI0020141EBC|nr:uncharacterized protein LOC125280655 isoform X2 [Megalobrama amblycephala]
MRRKFFFFFFFFLFVYPSSLLLTFCARNSDGKCAINVRFTVLVVNSLKEKVFEELKSLLYEMSHSHVRHHQRSWITEVTELENVDMMAENTKINISKKHRQSIDNPLNFNAENTSVQREDSISDDSEVFCTRHECENINENQTQETCSAGWDEGKSVPKKKNSVSSTHSLDSGYGSVKHKVFPIPENDEENKQTDVNFK